MKTAYHDNLKSKWSIYSPLDENKGLFCIQLAHNLFFAQRAIHLRDTN